MVAPKWCKTTLGSTVNHGIDLALKGVENTMPPPPSQSLAQARIDLLTQFEQAEFVVINDHNGKSKICRYV